METDVGGRMDSIVFGMLKKLNKKIDAIGNIPDEKITEAVNAYLDENPVAVGATLDENGVLYFFNERR